MYDLLPFCQEYQTVHQSIDQILMSNHSMLNMLKVNLVFELKFSDQSLHKLFIADEVIAHVLYE